MSARAAFQPATWNEEKRTATLVVSTGAAVLRWGWDADWYEELEISESAVRLDRLNSGAPVLDTHGTWSLEDVIGVVERAWIEGGQLLAEVRFSDRTDVQPFVQDVRDGIIRNVSVGYAIHKLELVEQSSDAPHRYRATDWEPMEVSLVPVPADAGAGVRSAKPAETFKCVIRAAGAAPTTKPKEGESMKDQKREGADAAVEPQDAAPGAVETEGTETPVVEDTPETDGGDRGADVVSEATLAERRRVREIRTAVRAAKLGDEFADKLIDGGVSVDAARKAVLDEMARQGGNVATNPHQPTQVGQHGAERCAEAISEAMLHRIDPGKHKLTEKARDFRAASLVEMGRQLAEAQGIRTSGLSRQEIAGLMVGKRVGGLHTTSDFPLVLANVANKVLAPSYMDAPAAYQAFCSRSDFTDFKPKYVLRIGDAVALKKVNEHGEFTRATIEEERETWSGETKGRIVGLSRQAIVNDDLGAFGRVLQSAGRSARKAEDKHMFELLTGAETLSDSAAVFNSTAGNLASAHATIDATAIAAARKYFGEVKGLDGDFIDIGSRLILVVGTELETEADQFLNGVWYPTAQGSAVPTERQRAMDLVVSPRITDDSWFVIVNPADAEALQYGFLDGAEAPYFEVREGFDVDGVELKIRHDFGGGWVDRRPAYKVPASGG